MSDSNFCGEAGLPDFSEKDSGKKEPSTEAVHVRQDAPPFDFSPWTPPFYYDDLGTRIVDAQERSILDVRGWGFLTGKGYAALGLDENKAEDIQQAVGEHVVQLLNASSVEHATKSEGGSEFPQSHD